MCHMNLDDLLHILVILQLLVASLCFHLSFVHDNDSISEVDKVNGMSDKYSCFVLENTLEDLGEDFLSNVSVKSRNWVIHKNNISVLIDSSSEADSCLLAT